MFTDSRGVPLRTIQHLWVSVVRQCVVNIGRAIPSFGLIVLFWLFATRVTWIGTSFWPLVLALVALALPPIFTNTYTAIREVDAATVEAARGMGYDESQMLRQIELPLASSVMFAGIRPVFVQVIATTAIGAIVANGGGLGRVVVDGFALGRGGRDAVLAGALLLAGRTLIADAALAAAEKRLIAAGVRSDTSGAKVADRGGAAG